MPRTRRCHYPNCHEMVTFPDHYCQQHHEHEAEYLASRQRWTRSHDKHYTHKYNTVTRYRNDTKRQQYNFYRTRQWSHLRQQVLERDHYLCAYCKAQGAITPAKTVDHVRPVEAFPDDKDNINNLAVICRECHYKKTEFEQKYYGCGQGNTITGAKPIDDINELALIMRGN
ncbi:MULTISPECIES: HNH endonuclease [Lactiplantibacillus]|uniref:HNH endonuclease n=1 Tax=Lactiplantibacillus TaxID=2767842 RepID=UPI000788FE0E|nr:MULTISPECIES: HNH endonuclease signature motif containing protein [Lactiplantibacillus]TYA05055.1 HNH endonuclease [Lactobacillus sp. CAB1-7]KYK51743.1 HNH endonuclease [Lactiplantibacillus plantarum]KYM68941.1 HNH endonuclease [Lactiplantibacillus plantarum]MBO2724194.1 HNH endonuclease [Lactiplantibacillus plantarum]MCM8651904.1 HNH endonuclease [Lactiplantibacillus sp. C232]